MHRLRPAYLAAAAWALVQVLRARRVLANGLPQPGVIGAPPRLAGDDRRPVLAVLRRTGSTCLVRSLVLQAWDAAHGTDRDVIIGVTGSTDFQAHAWLDGDPAEAGTHGRDFAELVRVPYRPA